MDIFDQLTGILIISRDLAVGRNIPPQRQHIFDTRLLHTRQPLVHHIAGGRNTSQVCQRRHPAGALDILRNVHGVAAAARAISHAHKIRFQRRDLAGRFLYTVKIRVRFGREYLERKADTTAV